MRLNKSLRIHTNIKIANSKFWESLMTEFKYYPITCFPPFMTQYFTDPSRYLQNIFIF